MVSLTGAETLGASVVPELPFCGRSGEEEERKGMRSVALTEPFTHKQVKARRCLQENGNSSLLSCGEKKKK